MPVCAQYTPTTDIDKGKEICSGFSEMPTYGKEPSQSCTPELPQEHAKSPWGAAPAPTPMALPTDAVHLPSHSSRSWVRIQSSVIVIQLPQSAMIHSPVSHLQPLAMPAWWLVSCKEGPPAPAGRRHPPGSPLPCLCVLALVFQPADNPPARKCSRLFLVHVHISFPKPGISSFYFSLCLSPGPVCCYFGLNIPM